MPGAAATDRRRRAVALSWTPPRSSCIKYEDVRPTVFVAGRQVRSNPDQHPNLTLVHTLSYNPNRQNGDLNPS